MNQMIKIELVWQEPTPKLEKARGVLLAALRGADYPPYWQEWRKTDKLLPHYLRHKSPLALFVNSRFASDFKDGFDDEARIRDVIRKLAEKPFKPALREPLWQRLSLYVLPATGLVLLPKCPLCWASYMSAMSTLGMGTVAYQPWLLHALVVVMGLSIAGLFYQARRRNRYSPALLALAGALLVAVSKIFLDLRPPMYAGLLMLFVAAVWSSFQEARRAQPKLL